MGTTHKGLRYYSLFMIVAAVAYGVIGFMGLSSGQLPLFAADTEITPVLIIAFAACTLVSAVLGLVAASKPKAALTALVWSLAVFAFECVIDYISFNPDAAGIGIDPVEYVMFLLTLIMTSFTTSAWQRSKKAQTK